MDSTGGGMVIVAYVACCLDRGYIRKVRFTLSVLDFFIPPTHPRCLIVL